MRKDRTKLIVACRNFANAPNNAGTGFVTITSGFYRSLSLQRSSVVIFVSMLLLLEGQAIDVCKLSNSATLRLSGCNGQNSMLTMFLIFLF